MINSSLSKGFTLIEILVVVSIISVLSSIVFPALNSARGKGRDVLRKQQMVQLRNALESYYADNGQYPMTEPLGTGGDSAGGYNIWWTSNAAGDPGLDPTHAGGNLWIPGLVPTYISALPQDPLSGALSTWAACSSQGSWHRAYTYQSDGYNYKLLAHCAPENSVSANDTFADTNPLRAGHSFSIQSPSYSGSARPLSEW